MKFTNKQIATTNSKVLRAILINMSPQIENGIAMAVNHQQNQTKQTVSEFGIECIEASLLFDLYKGVVSYTKDSDTIESFESGISIKGNFELNGVVIRDGVKYGFRIIVTLQKPIYQTLGINNIVKTSIK